MASCSTLTGKAEAAAVEAIQIGGGDGGLLGLITASMAVFSAVFEPPRWLHRSGYSLLLSAIFFAGMAEVTAAVVVVSADPCRRRAYYAWRKLTRYACAVSLLAGAIIINL